MTQAYPLTWPKNWPRVKDRKASQFKTSIERAISNVEGALKAFALDSKIKVENMLVSSNYGLTTRNPEDPGVAVYFTWDGLSTCIAVDRYARLEENLQAIYHCIEAERTKLRHGGLNLVRAAFRGYAALPPPSSADGRAWRTVLKVHAQCDDLTHVEYAYKILAQQAHPDKPGGDAGKMAELNAAIAAARSELTS